MRLSLTIAEPSCRFAGSVSYLRMRDAGSFNNILSDIVTIIPDENIVTSLLSTFSNKPITLSLFTSSRTLLLLDVDSGEITMFSSGIEVTMSEKILPKEPASLIHRSPETQADLHEGYAIVRGFRDICISTNVAWSTRLGLEPGAAIT